MLTHTDAQIGRLVDYLEKSGQLDDTIIVFLSDNGASAEGGVKDPLIISYPAGISKEQQGTVRSQYHHVSDLTPTILDILGVEKPELNYLCEGYKLFFEHAKERIAKLGQTIIDPRARLKL